MAKADVFLKRVAYVEEYRLFASWKFANDLNGIVSKALRIDEIHQRPMSIFRKTTQ